MWRIASFDASPFESHFAAEVKGFDAEALLGRRLARRMDRFTQFAVAATQQALGQAGLTINETNRGRVGVIVGTGIGGIATLLEEIERMRSAGPRRVSPFMVPMMLPDGAAGQIAIVFGARGPNMAVVTAWIKKLSKTRLARECAKPDPKEERALAEEGLAGSRDTWPEHRGATSAGPI